MKKFIFLLLATTFLGFVGYRLPFFIYTQIISKGISSKWLTIKTPQKSLVNGSSITFGDEKKIATIDDKTWQLLHLRNLKIPLPINDPEIMVVPVVQFQGKNYNPRIGFKIIDRDGGLLFSIVEMPTFELSINVTATDDELFNYPIISETINNIPVAKFWNDLFSKQLQSPSQRVVALPYNLFLLKKRVELFSTFNPATLGHYLLRDMGLIKSKQGPIDKETIEYLFIRTDTLMYPFKIVTKNLDPTSAAIRSKVVTTLEFLKSDPNIFHDMYTTYKSLDYESKIGQKGMIYLFVAFSHQLENEKILKEMIQFLERGKGNMHFVLPLYEYAYAKYETNFSKFNEPRSEPEPEILPPDAYPDDRSKNRLIIY